MKLSTTPLISLLFFLCGCSNETLLQEYDMNHPIQFVTQCLQLETKAAGIISGSTLPAESTISIFSLQHPVNESLSKWAPTLFNNTLGIADSEGNILYDNLYYFPVGEQLDFFAVYPFLSEMESSYSDDALINIELQTDAQKQVDLMYASLLNQSKKETKLVFNFHHLLTQVTFNIIQGAGALIDLPLTKIEIISPQSGILNLWNGELLVDTDPLTTYALSTHKQIENVTPIPGCFLLFPEKASEFIFTFGENGSHIFHIAPPKEPSRWEAGKCYQYNITINKNITDQPIFPADPSEPEDTLPTEDPTPSENNTDAPNTDQADSDSSSSTDELPGNEQEPTTPLPEEPEETLPEAPVDSTINQTTNQTVDVETKTKMSKTRKVVIIDLSLN